MHSRLRILAIEQSTALGSAALLEGDAALAEVTWSDARGVSSGLIRQLPELLARAGVGLDAVELFAVGLGPGSFSGLRTSLAAVRAMALPGAAPVLGVGSAEALAGEVLKLAGVTAAVVVGDARRGRLWAGRFTLTGPAADPAGELRLLEPPELRALTGPGVAVASPDWTRLADLLRGSSAAGTQLLEQPAIPAAAAVGRLARQRLAADPALARRGGEPLAPIYLHPPVTATPREEPPAERRQAPEP